MSSPATSAHLAEERALLLSQIATGLQEVDLAPLEGARFLHTHQVFEERSSQRQRIVDWLCDEFTPRVAIGAPCRALSVGCGSGTVDLAVARRLTDRSSRLRYVGVNPNRVECAAFERRFDRAALPATSFEVAPTTFEGFQTTERFEVIQFVQCLYYFADPVEEVARAKRMLAPGGALAIFQAPLEELNKLATHFYDREHGRRTTFAADLASQLAARGIDFERARIDSRLEVTPMLADDPAIGVALRDFIVQVDGRRLPPSIQQLVAQYLRLVAYQESDKAFISHPVDVFVIDG